MDMDVQSLSISFFWEKLKLQAVVKKWRNKYVGNHPLYSQVEGRMQREIKRTDAAAEYKAVKKPFIPKPNANSLLKLLHISFKLVTRIWC